MTPFRIDLVSLRVRDLETVRGFYESVLGLAVLQDGPGRAVLGAGGTALLQLLHAPDALPDVAGEAGLFHAAFLLPGRADLGRFLSTLPPLDGAADHLVSEAVYLHDPEGNGIEVYADRPASGWRWHGPHVQMANARLDMPGLIAAAAGMPWDGAPAGTRIGHVHLRAGGTEGEAAFFRGALGLSITADWPGAVFAAANGYHHHLAANTWSSAAAGPRDMRRAGLAGITIATDREATIADPWGTVFHLRKDTTQP